MQFDFLSSVGDRVWLCNCEVSDKRVLSGMAYLSVSPGQEVELFAPDGRSVCTVDLPLELRTHQTPVAITEPNDDIELKVLRLSTQG